MLSILFTHFVLTEYSRLRRAVPALPMDIALNLACLTVIDQLERPGTGRESWLADYDERTLEYQS